ncbi:MAG: hypothetical protein OJF61_000132 [Rhodanobacteraceae bacterium]|nr:MAG: hypothetical protein OJF61_000132 [Rhodanobacteraceae bacterium]
MLTDPAHPDHALFRSAHAVVCDMESREGVHAREASVNIWQRH